MKRSVLFLTLALIALSAGAQPRNPQRNTKQLDQNKIVLRERAQQPEQSVSNELPMLKTETFTLSNGLKVIVAEDHSEPKIYGSVIVHAGSKNEDTAATGVAHYFEHIMFKGTDRIGTTNWAKEKPYLDSISDAYDRLTALNRRAAEAANAIIDSTLDKKARKEVEKQHKQLLANLENERHAIQLEINRLNIEASKYAIANETDAILQQMGCTGLNAGTTYDYTVYYNTLPSNQLENWMEVYAERFRNPVYRLFQGELEAVYEERNLYANEMMYTFSRNLFTESFGEHPYSRDIIGWDRHLKSPQPSAMKRFYDKYYVASNMTLLLVGDLNTREARELAEKYFSIWPTGKKIREPHYQLPQFDSRVVKEVKQTPIKAGLMIFPGIKSGADDEVALSILSELLSGGTGSLDQLATDGRLMAASLMPLSLQDAGTNVILYIPKLLGQKHEAAEDLIWQCIDSVKQGRFSDKLLESIKMRHLVGMKQMLESYSGIASLLQGLECEGRNYNDWLKDIDRLQHITKQDIMTVARRYFDRDHCTLVRSSMGFPDKDAAIKPDWDHLDAQNQGMQSPFAKHIAERKVKEIQPQVIDFKKEVAVLPVSKSCNLYASPNSKNDLFSLTIAYHYGTMDNRHLAPAVDYFNNIGAGNYDLQQYNIELDRLGGSFSISAGDDYSYLTLSGPEQNMEQIVELALFKFHTPRHDAQQLKNQMEAMEASKEAAKNDASTWSSALMEYVLYGQQSHYLDHTTLKEMKKLSGEQMLQLVDSIFTRDGYVTYVGNADPALVVQLLQRENLVHPAVSVKPQRTRIPAVLSDNAVYYCTNSRFLKSDIQFYMPSTRFDHRKDRAACSLFNEYMGGGMNSVFFQEIREFRSLGYSTYGYFTYDYLNRHPAHYFAYLGTQCDKTNDGVEAVRDLMVNFPARKDKFRLSRDYLISVRNSNYIGFRSLPAQVRYWTEIEHLDHDPRQQVTDQIRHMRYDQLEEFHQKYVAGRPLVVFITGNAKKFDLKALGQYGKVKEIKYKDMIKF